MFADTHCHLDFPELSSKLLSLQDEMTNKRLGMIIIPSVARKNWSNVVEICDQDNRFFFGLGLHPYYIDNHEISDASHLAREVSNFKKEKSDKLVAVGEIGLDFTCPNKEKQIGLFEAQLAIAEEYELPVIIHTRKAHAETLRSLKKYNLVGGVVHAFSGSFELMMGYVDQGLKIGVGPVITWPTSTKTRNAIMKAPLDVLLLETDSPDMAVAGVEKGFGSPVNVREVFSELNKIRNESESRLESVLWESSIQLFMRKPYN